MDPSSLGSTDNLEGRKLTVQVGPPCAEGYQITTTVNGKTVTGILFLSNPESSKKISRAGSVDDTERHHDGTISQHSSSLSQQISSSRQHFKPEVPSAASTSSSVSGDIALGRSPPMVTAFSAPVNGGYFAQLLDLQSTGHHSSAGLLSAGGIHEGMPVAIIDDKSKANKRKYVKSGFFRKDKNKKFLYPAATRAAASKDPRTSSGAGDSDSQMQDDQDMDDVFESSMMGERRRASSHSGSPTRQRSTRASSTTSSSLPLRGQYLDRPPDLANDAHTSADRETDISEDVTSPSPLASTSSLPSASQAPLVAVSLRVPFPRGLHAGPPGVESDIDGKSKVGTSDTDMGGFSGPGSNAVYSTTNGSSNSQSHWPSSTFASFAGQPQSYPGPAVSYKMDPINGVNVVPHGTNGNSLHPFLPSSHLPFSSAPANATNIVSSFPQSDDLPSAIDYRAASPLSSPSSSSSSKADAMTSAEQQQLLVQQQQQLVLSRESSSSTALGKSPPTSKVLTKAGKVPVLDSNSLTSDMPFILASPPSATSASSITSTSASGRTGALGGSFAYNALASLSSPSRPRPAAGQASPLGLKPGSRGDPSRGAPNGLDFFPSEQSELGPGEFAHKSLFASTNSLTHMLKGSTDELCRNDEAEGDDDVEMNASENPTNDFYEFLLEHMD